MIQQQRQLEADAVPSKTLRSLSLLRHSSIELSRKRITHSTLYPPLIPHSISSYTGIYNKKNKRRNIINIHRRREKKTSHSNKQPQEFDYAISRAVLLMSVSTDRLSHAADRLVILARRINGTRRHTRVLCVCWLSLGVNTDPPIRAKLSQSILLRRHSNVKLPHHLLPIK